MNYSLNELIDFIARHDEHEGYYREQLNYLLRNRDVAAWDRFVDILSAHHEDSAPGVVADMEARNPFREAKL